MSDLHCFSLIISTIKPEARMTDIDEVRKYKCWWQVKFISILFRIISLNKNFLISICIKETFKLTLQGERSKTNNISWNTFPKFLH